jgi:hypothetical protein
MVLLIGVVKIFSHELLVIIKFIGTYQSLFIFSAQLKLFNTLKRKNEKLN